MITVNPFAELTALLPPAFMQVYIVVMVLAVVIGTLFDVVHKKSARFFAQQSTKSETAATRQLGGAEKFSLAIRTIAVEVLTAGEFHNQKRRVSHLFLFYGFLLYLITTVVMVFAYPGNANTPVILPLLWNIGALMVLMGGGWFFFFLRVNVANEGHSPFRLIHADLFIGSLLASVLFALVWEWAQTADNAVWTSVFFGIYLFFTTLLFVSVPWSKFAHMFFKPVVAFQRRVEEANGSTDLPAPANVRHIQG